ncbi:hypothetical protein [Desulfurispira natronophila]|uniref:hypothetical protein n=1 Tax=Desulfurispira natronophila TaxID=682562 RepID=UPI001C860A57|nr:hypothetical protein [Desulfurispira natronophila]
MSLSLLSGCAADDPDAGTANAPSLPMKGVVSASHVAGARVFFDVDGDYRWQYYEPFSRSGTAGTFSQPGQCSGSNPAHCLKVTRLQTESPDALLRAYGGRDRITGEPFHGMLSRKITTTGVTQVLSPITTLLTYMDAYEQNRLRENEGRHLGDDPNYLSTSDLYLDYFDFDSTLDGDKRVHLIKRSLQFHKTADVIDALLQDLYNIDHLAEGSNDPISVTGPVYAAIAEVMMEPRFDGEISPQKTINDIIERANELVQELINVSDLADVDTAFNPQVLDLWQFIGDLYDGDETEQTTLESYLRAVEIVTTVLREKPLLNIVNDITADVLNPKGTGHLDPAVLGPAADLRGIIDYLIAKSSNDWHESELEDYLTRQSISDKLAKIDRKIELSSGEEAQLAYDDGTLKLQYGDESLQAEIHEINDYTAQVSIEIAPGVREWITIKSTKDDYEVISR